MEKNIDYSLILQAIASYLVWAKDFFWNITKNDFSLWLIPDWHHIYTGTLKALWYKLLKKTDTLVLIWEWAINNKISVLWDLWETFMGRKWWKNLSILNILETYDFVDVIGHKFDRIDYELPFFRVISDYKNVVFLEIWDALPKTKLINLLTKISKEANLLFISDFNTDKPIKICKKLDKQILNLDFVWKDQNLFVIEIFLMLAKKMKKNPDVIWYLNTWDISTDKDSTTGFGCIMI